MLASLYIYLYAENFANNHDLVFPYWEKRVKFWEIITLELICCREVIGFFCLWWFYWSVSLRLFHWSGRCVTGKSYHWQYRVSPGKVDKINRLCWINRFQFMLILWVLCVSKKDTPYQQKSKSLSFKANLLCPFCHEILCISNWDYRFLFPEHLQEDLPPLPPPPSQCLPYLQHKVRMVLKGWMYLLSIWKKVILARDP